MACVLALAAASVRVPAAEYRVRPLSLGLEQGEPTSRAAVLIDAETGTVLYEHNARAQLPPASMTKLMLMLLVAERVRDGQLFWHEPVATSAWASKMGGSQVYLAPGETFTLGEMMTAVIVHSANDAAVAVAERVAGTAQAFVKLMNERAAALGMKDTVYRTVHGLPPGSGQQPDLTSAYDVAVLAREVVKYPDLLKWSDTVETTFRNGEMKLLNTNYLLQQIDWVDGLKTGFYSGAGFNVTATGQKNGMRLISVVMGAGQKDDCFREAGRLLKEGFANYQRVVAVSRGDVVAVDVRVKGGRPRFVRVIAGSSLTLVARKDEKRDVRFQLAITGELQPPLKAEEPIGQVIVRNGDTELGRVPALVAESVVKAGLLDRFY